MEKQVFENWILVQKELTHWKRPWCWEGLGQEEKGTTEDEMAGWHYQLDGHEFEWTPRAGDGQGGLACCNSWGHKESDTTEWLNWTELNWTELNWRQLEYSSLSWILLSLTLVWLILLKKKNVFQCTSLLAPLSMWDFNFPARDWITFCCTGRWVLTTGPPGKSFKFLKCTFIMTTLQVALNVLRKWFFA